MKRCTKCKLEKPQDDFPSLRKASDGKALWCRSCFHQNWKARYYTNHALYKQKHTESRNRLRLEKARKVYEYLMTHPCTDCGESDPVVLEFDHKDGCEKTNAIAQLVADNRSWKNILAEIAKCDVRCANCHRRKTAAQFSYKRFLFAEQ